MFALVSFSPTYQFVPSAYDFPVKDWLLYAFAVIYPSMIFSIFFSRDSAPFWVVILMLLVAAAEFVRTRGEVWADRSLLYLFLFVLVYLFGVYLVANEDSHVTWLGRSPLDRAVGTMVRVVYVFAAFFVFTNFLADASGRVILRLFKIQIWCGSAVAFFGIMQYVAFTLFGTDVLSQIQPTNETFGSGAFYLQRVGREQVFRASGIFKEPSSFGIFLVPLMVKLLVTYVRGVFVGSRVIHTGLLAVFTLAILANFSLTALLSLTVLGGIFAARRLARSPAAGIGILIGFLGMAIALMLSPIGNVLVDRLANVFELRDKSTIDRAVRLFTSYLVFLKHPWLGVGPGGYAFWYPRMGGLDTSTMVTPLNIWLNVLTDVGIVGFIPFVAFLWRVLTRGARASQSLPLAAAYFWSAIAYLLLLSTTDIWFIEIIWFELAMVVTLSSTRQVGAFQEGKSSLAL